MNKNFIVILSSIAIALVAYNQHFKANYISIIPSHVIASHSAWAEKYNKFYKSPQELQYRL
jgi:cathepsin L